MDAPDVDALTGLPTRRHMLDRLHAAGRAGGTLAMVDIDLFKNLNNRHGHAEGDGVLVAVAQRLRDGLPQADWIARLGGDEFVVHMPCADVDRAQALFERWLGHLRRPIALRDGDVVVTASIGLVPTAGRSVDALLRDADIALYAAKCDGRDRVVVFGTATRAFADERRAMHDAAQALHRRIGELHDAARTDALTGLRNRLALDEALDAPADGGAAVAFVDVDHFGAYNHLHGDSAGDDALRAVAAALCASARGDDFAFRKGGEEFVVAIPAVDAGAAAAVAERIRDAVQALAIPHAGSGVAPVLTVTVGVAHGGAGVTLRRLLDAASAQAMRAKVDGARNRVHAAPPATA